MWIDIRVFNSISLVNLSVFIPIPVCFQNCIAIVECEVRDGDASRNSFIVQDCFGYSVFFFHIKLGSVLSKSEKKISGILMSIALNNFDKIAIFTMLILPMQEHGRSFHFLMSSLISVFKDLKFLLHRFFPCIARVTPRYFMLFMAIVKGDVSLISFSARLSSVYRRYTDFFLS